MNVPITAATGSTADVAGDIASLPVPPLSNEDAWQRLPTAVRGDQAPLPNWARQLAGHLPRTTAALLELDLAQRTRSPVAPGLRAAMRWVSARANGCRYAETVALADARRAKVGEAQLQESTGPQLANWTDGERAALEFARKMTVESDSVTDDEFAALVGYFGEHQAASMVLLMAYANFQDRLLLCLETPLESANPLPPVEVTFEAGAFVIPTTPPPPLKPAPTAPPASDALAATDADWKTVSFDVLQERLESQRNKPTRLRIPEWHEVERQLPEGLMRRSSDIVWYRIVFGYAPELAVPFEIFMRTAGAEASPHWDRIFGGSLFWVTTRSINCPYCMGHCEMNWEVAGLTLDQIAERSRQLAEGDWAAFTPAEQRALAFARKLTLTPGEISRNDVAQIQEDFGPEKAIAILLNASRHHYMTRISNGFQLTLERENVFYDYYNLSSPSSANPTRLPTPAVRLLSNEETWARLPKATSGHGQPLPNWVRGVAEYLPRTAAAMLALDFAQRTQSPLDPLLRGKLRWVIANANRCEYSKAYAEADLKRAGIDAYTLRLLEGPSAEWPETDREPLEFARLLTVGAPTVSDQMFAGLRNRFGDSQVAAMVLLAAYGNFQDRIVLGLNLPLEADGPLPPVAVRFAEGAFQLAPYYPEQNSKVTSQAPAGLSVVPHDDDWERTSFDELQTRLEDQRGRTPRLPIPAWEDVRPKLPPEMATKPTGVVWNLVCFGYVPELAVPWSTATRTMWAETQPDRVFEESLFWIQTRAIGCNYCMGHCEMLLQAAGLDRDEVADRTRRLAGSDWSTFSPVEQRAYAYARKLSRTPWELTPADYRHLESDLGQKQALATFWWLCRGLYMTRVSDGFQLPLERENVFALPPGAR